MVAKKLMAVRANVRASSDLAIDIKALISSGTTIGPVPLLTETDKAELAHFLNLLRENRFFRYELMPRPNWTSLSDFQAVDARRLTVMDPAYDDIRMLSHQEFTRNRPVHFFGW
ncbi:hypothetical protein [Rhizobium leguminosarum]|uniref:hypothetical protein n=1 Tax=Rhizobium leguminosarum TaxID=384 RepID=UPI0018F880C6|nr:hypothetical protein [Rhizobium leguminosarum]